ncbi:hypothetical protein V1264_015811 [Littorina saxatilis]|uniref:RING-type domain-containing protein n=1 Tax=Littorina saxatilis TaxID=31220 RepID=A0AAN9GIG3_9CAEN
MAERSLALQKCKTVPERDSLDRSESDARQLDLQQRAQDSQPDPEKPGRSPVRKNSHRPPEHEDGVYKPALSSQNLKKNVRVVSKPETSNTDQEAIATSASSTDTQASGHWPHVPTDHANSVSSATSDDVSSASSALNGRQNGIGNVPTAGQPTGCQHKHMDGAAMYATPASERGTNTVVMRNSRVATINQRDVLPWERELGVQVRDADGAVDLASARRARRWNSGCFACREADPELTLLPCGHSILCQRCYMDQHFEQLPELCPLCCKQVLGMTFTEGMLNFLLRRSAV